MNLKFYLYMAILIFTVCRCSAPPEQPVIIEKSHKVSITGFVNAIDRTNIDKSGKNPRFMLHFVLQIESYDDGGWEIVLGPEIKCVMQETDLLEQTGQQLKTSGKVLIEAHTAERSPKIIAVYTIKHLMQEQDYDKAD